MSDSNSLFNRMLRDHRNRQPDDDPEPEPDEQRDRTVGSGTFEVGDSETVQPNDDDSWMSGVQERGIPRGSEAWEARELGSTAAMEIVKNTITDQVTGGEMAFPSEEGDDVPDEVVQLQEMFGQILSGPHLMGDDFDDLVSATVSDMIDNGESFWETLAAKNAEEQIPVLALKPVDVLTVRINVDANGNWREGDDGPAYYQAPYQTYQGDTISLGDTEPVALDRDDVVSLQWPGSRRSDRIYPLSPTMQVKQWLELLSNATTHLNRYYNDNEIPAGILSVPGVNQSNIDDIAGDLEDASADPRQISYVANEASWVEMGGTAIDLNVIEEQKWFLQLCWGAVGLNKHEIGLIEDVNRNTAEQQSTVIYKRVTLPLTRTIEQAVERQILEQFEVYRALDRPFSFALNHSDPARERQREQDLIERYEKGTISYAEFRRQIGEEPEDTEVELPNGETFDYGPHPKNITEILINAYKSSSGPDDPDDPIDGEGEGDEDGDDEDGGSGNARSRAVVSTGEYLVLATTLTEPLSIEEAREYIPDDVEAKSEPKAVFHDQDDEKVCDDCAELDGEVMEVSEAQETVPVHKNCRCYYDLVISWTDVAISA